MKAIVLSFDRRLALVDHMIHTYQKVWPSNPFQFRVPYQNYPRFLAEKYGEKIELRQARAPIKATMEDLLADIGDEEWVYWCMDDKYVIRIDEKKVSRIYNWVREVTDPTICGALFCRCRKLLQEEYLIPSSRLENGSGQVFIERRNYWEIWIHQFLRARVLKRLFQSFPDETSRPGLSVRPGRPFCLKDLDEFVGTRQVEPDQRLFVVENNLALFGESASRGEITPNCIDSFKKFGLEVPKEFKIHRHRIFMGQLPRRFLGIPIPWLSRTR